MTSRQTELEVLIPLACLLGILVITFIILLFKFYLCPNCLSYDKKVNLFDSPIIGSPLLPTTTIHEIQIKPNEQVSLSPNLQVPPPKRGRKNGYFRLLSDRDETAIVLTEDEIQSIRSEASLSEGTLLSDHSDSSEIPALRRSSNTYSEKSYKQKKKLKTKRRKHSEPARPRTHSIEDFTALFTRERSRSELTRRYEPSTITVTAPASGQLEFMLFYNSEDRNLEITILQLLDMCLDAKCFLGILDVYDVSEKPSKYDKAYLRLNENSELEFINTEEIGYFVYITLLPRKAFRRYTTAIFGHGSILFNEKVLLPGYSLEHLQSMSLCFHVLCRFGRDGDPIVLGETQVALSGVSDTKISTFVPFLQAQSEELNLESCLRTSTDLGHLEIYLSYNPMSLKLTVTIIKARGLPKFALPGQQSVSVKLSLYFCSGRIERRKTKRKRNREPEFNETFTFDIVREKLSEYDLLFELRNHAPMYKAPFGYVVVGNSGGSEGKQHWLQLLDFSHHTKFHKIMPFKPVNLL